MSSHNASKCSKCPVGRHGDMLFTDVGNTASWIAARYSNLQYALKFPNRHLIYKALPGFGVNNYIPDILHTKHLGVDCYFLASVITYIIRYMMPHDEATNLKNFVREMTHQYEKMKGNHRVQYLSKTILKKADASVPCLTGVRGVQIRSLIPIVGEILRLRHNPLNAQHRDMLKGLEFSEQFDRILLQNSNVYALSTEDSKALIYAAFEYTKRNVALIRHFRGQDVKLFNLTIKTHYFLELALVSEFTNPLYGSCYQGEQMMQVVRKLVASTANGCPMEKAGNFALRKYIRGLTMTLDPKNGFGYSL